MMRNFAMQMQRNKTSDTNTGHKRDRANAARYQEIRLTLRRESSVVFQLKLLHGKGTKLLSVAISLKTGEAPMGVRRQN